MDKIVYCLIALPGGVDGMDIKGFPNEMLVDASFNLASMQKRKGHDTRYRIEKRVVDVKAASEVALRKLDPIDKLVLGHVKPAPVLRESRMRGLSRSDPEGRG